MWKIFHLIFSVLILVVGVVTVVQFARLVWQKKTPENERKFRHLAIRFIVLMVLAVAMLILVRVSDYVRLMGNI